MNNCKSLSIRLKRSEFQELALKYGVEQKEHRTTNITVCRSDFKQIDSNNLVVSISLNRSNFSRERNKQSVSKVAVQKQSNDNENVPKIEYSLRKRKLRVDDLPTAPPAKKPSKEIVRYSPMQKLLIEPKHLLKKGIVVLAHMKWFPPWPAFIQSLRPSCVEVIFFGENQTGTVPYNKVGLFEKNHALIRSLLKKSGYIKAVKSAEGVLNIPSHLSITL